MVYLSMDVDCAVGDASGSHGVLGVDERYVAPTLDRMMPRFLDFCAEHGIVLTFFLVAETINSPARRAVVRRIVAEGHEIASHSLTHPKSFGLLDAATLKAEIGDSKRLIEDMGGVEVTGFRAPGFYINDRVLEAVIEAGYRYSSSVNGALGYNVAKMVVGSIANVASRGRSVSYHVEPGCLFAPRFPYQPAAGQFWRAGNGPSFCEIPVSTGFGQMLPAVTFATDKMLPAPLRTAFYKRMIDRLPVANVVLHDFEFLESDDFHPSTALPRTTAMMWHVPRESKYKLLLEMARSGVPFGLLRDLAPAPGVTRAAAPA